MPVIVNVAGESVEDYVEVARRLDGQPGVAGIELNISCPNVGKGGLQFALDPDACGRGHRGRPRRDRPAADGQAVARRDRHPRHRQGASRHAGADAIRRVNTLSGMAIDLHRRKPLLGNTYGGLSGPALKPVALRVVYEVAQVVDIPIVAIGGIGSLDDVLEFLFAGASAVQVGTAVFADPVLPSASIDELEAWCATRGYAHTARDRRRGAAAAARQAQRQRRGVPAMSEDSAPASSSSSPTPAPTGEGHFKLKSGRHGDRYIEKFQVLQWPERVTETVVRC